MNHLYSVLLAAAILYVAPIVANPLSMERGGGGSSIHYKTVEEGLWPYQVEKFAGGQARNADISVPAPGSGQWI